MQFNFIKKYAILAAASIAFSGQVFALNASGDADKNELEQLKAEVEAGERAHTDVQNEIDQLKAELTQIQEQKTQLNAEIEKMKAELQQAQ